MAAHIKALWGDAGIAETWDRRSEYQVIESNEHYFKQVDAVSAPGYLPQRPRLSKQAHARTGFSTETFSTDTFSTDTFLTDSAQADGRGHFGVARADVRHR